MAPFRLPTLIVALAFAGTCLMAQPALAEPNCTCRYKGMDIPEGQMICADLPSGQVLMQCGRVLNNTAWKTLSSECPFALKSSPIEQQIAAVLD